MSADAATRCAECGSQLGPAEGYCLACGARAGARGLLLEALLRRTQSTTRPTRSPAPARASRAHGLLLALPSPGVCTLLVLAFLGFGVLAGAAASSPAGGSPASARRPLRLVVPTSPATSATATPAPEGPASPASEASAPEAPATQPQPTPSAPAPTAQVQASPSAGHAGAGGAGSASGEGPASESAPPAAPTRLPAVKHVFVIMLSDEPYASVFGPASSAPYLSHTLESSGELLVRYFAVAHQELANEVALLSGQGPTVQTAADCPLYSDIVPARGLPDDQVAGQGCVYPSSARTLADQLTAKRLSWRAYVEGIEEAGGTDPCTHPAPGEADSTATLGASGPRYATFRNPFVYFHSLTDSTRCRSEDVGLGRLGADLARAESTPSFSYIVPDRCHDGSPSPCEPGAQAGMAAADAFLRRVVPPILASAAYRRDGLLAITVDQAPSSGELADSSSCCGQPVFPNLPPAPAGALGDRGGGQVGALLLSPFAKPGATVRASYNHFSLLRTLEDLFGLAHLGYARAAGVSSFEAAMFRAPAAGHR